MVNVITTTTNFTIRLIITELFKELIIILTNISVKLSNLSVYKMLKCSLVYY